MPTMYYVNIRPNRHSEIPKSKATYSRADNTKTNGENIYRKLMLERKENHQQMGFEEGTKGHVPLLSSTIMFMSTTV